jgi:hypothetical protein
MVYDGAGPLYFSSDSCIWDMGRRRRRRRRESWRRRRRRATTTSSSILKHHSTLAHTKTTTIYHLQTYGLALMLDTLCSSYPTQVLMFTQG